MKMSLEEYRQHMANNFRSLPSNKSMNNSFKLKDAMTPDNDKKRDKTSNYLLLDCAPNTKPRQTRADKWKKRDCVMKYRDFADYARAEALKQNFVLGDVVKIVFVMPMPKSWSKKKKAEMCGKPHRQRPDTDNLTKAVKDALRKGGSSDDDSTIWDEHGRKFWGYTGQVFIQNVEPQALDCLSLLSMFRLKNFLGDE